MSDTQMGVGALRRAVPIPLAWGALGILGGGLIGAHVYAASLTWDATGLWLVLDRAFDMAFALVIGAACVGVGAPILRTMRLQIQTRALYLAIAFGIGAGILSLALLALGLLHLLYVPVILAVLALGMIGNLKVLREHLTPFLFSLQGKREIAWGRAETLLLGLLVVLVVPVLFVAMTPPLDNDALNYHLYAPALFLQQHAVTPQFDNVGANYPIALDFLYLFGLAAGTDIVPNLLQLLFAGAVTLALYGFAAPRFGRVTALLACVIFWCSSVIALEASAPIIDLAWGAYEFFAVIAFLCWRESRRSGWLVLLGWMLGLAASNKYLALAGWGVIFALVVLTTARDARATKSVRILARAAVWNTAWVLIPALLVAAPWYLKNLAWFSNLVYPFFTGSYGLGGTLNVGSGDPGGWVGLGLGRDLAALLFFPYNVYFRWEYFNFAYNRGGPTYFFWLLPLYLIVRRSRTLTWMLAIVGLRFLIWFAYAQNIRYIVFVFPLLALVCAYCIVAVLTRWNRPAVRVVLGTIVTVCIVLGILLQWGLLFILREQAPQFVLGQISRNAYLTANLHDYRAVQFMNRALPADARILALGDQRLYYLKRAAYADEAHDNWMQLERLGGDAEGIARTMRTLGVTHVWVSEDDLTYFENNWKLASPLKSALFAAFRQTYLQPLYTDEDGYAVFKFQSD